MNRILKNLVYHFPWLFSDRRYLELYWQLRTGSVLDFEHPLTFNEKIQWLKLYDRRDDYTVMADKADAKDYVAGIIGKEHIIPTLGVYDSANDIDWDSLPESFVLKCTHDSGGIIICRDKNTLDRKKAAAFLEKNRKRRFYYLSREWCYKNIRPRIICEQFMEDKGQAHGLVDYKFFCFGGKPEFLYVSEGLEDHSTAKISFADLDGKLMPFKREDYEGFTNGLPIPEHFGQMKEIAAEIAGKINNRFVRVDLYEINGCIYFSELTFYPNGGFIPFSPAEWDRKIGEMIHL